VGMGDQQTMASTISSTNKKNREHGALAATSTTSIGNTSSDYSCAGF
jgi:hypothetical protein